MEDVHTLLCLGSPLQYAPAHAQRLDARRERRISIGGVKCLPLPHSPTHPARTHLETPQNATAHSSSSTDRPNRTLRERARWATKGRRELGADPRGNWRPGLGKGLQSITSCRASQDASPQERGPKPQWAWQPKPRTRTAGQGSAPTPPAGATHWPDPETTVGCVPSVGGTRSHAFGTPPRRREGASVCGA